MNQTQLISLPNADALAQLVATAWLQEIARANQAGQPYFVALSGGRISLNLFRAVVELSRRQNVLLTEVHFFWADERCVPPTDPESSFRAADETLFRPLAIAADHIHRIRGEEIPVYAAELANAEIKRLVPHHPAGQLVLDLILLGLGEDAHVASLFPGESAATRNDPEIYRVITNSPKPPPNRVTLGYATIATAKQVWVLASGAGKEAALRDSLQPGGKTPLGQVLELRPHTKVFTDIKLGN